MFLSIPAFFNPRRMGEGPTKFLWDLLEPARFSNSIFQVVLFYTNIYLIIPLLYFRHKYIAFIASILASLCVFAIINYPAPPPLHGNGGPMPSMPLGNSFNIFMLIIVYVCSFLICLYQQYHTIKEDRLNTRLSFLTAQVNPHFLFNTLNSIHSLSLVKSDKTSDAIVKLSGIMRYAFNEGSQVTVELSKEIGYITSYVELQKLRLTDEVTVSMRISNNSPGLWIVPFLLIPFVENAFKHGVNGEDDAEIDIRIDVYDKSIELYVANDIVHTRNRENSTGVGISTTRQRLQLLYPNRHSLAISTNQNKFVVQLHLDLK